MADQSTRNLEGLAKDILVKIQNSYIPTDFVVLDMGHNEEVPLLLERPFLNTLMLSSTWDQGMLIFIFKAEQ